MERVYRCPRALSCVPRIRSRLLDVMSGSVSHLNLAQDVAPAAWLAESDLEFGVATSFVPTGLDAYVQVLHPAETRDGDRVRWGEIADWPRTPLLPGVWFQDLEELAAAKPESDRPWAHQPHEGEVPREVLDRLRPCSLGTRPPGTAGPAFGTDGASSPAR